MILLLRTSLFTKIGLKSIFLYVYSAAEKLMGSDDASLKPKRKEKRDAEADGRDLLVAYLSDVGGYDRNYRDVEDEDESGSSGNNINVTIVTYSPYYLFYR